MDRVLIPTVHFFCTLLIISGSYPMQFLDIETRISPSINLMLMYQGGSAPAHVHSGTVHAPLFEPSGGNDGGGGEADVLPPPALRARRSPYSDTAHGSIHSLFLSSLSVPVDAFG